MISNLAEKAVDIFLSCSDVKEDRELYVYGFFMLFSKILFCIITVVFGSIFGVLVESILFYFMFIILRSFAGGIHASSEHICTISTTLSMLASIILIWIGKRGFGIISLAIAMGINTVIVVMLSPQDSAAKRLTEKERSLYKKYTIIILLIIHIIAGISLLIHCMGLFTGCSVCVLLESILLILGKTQQNHSRTINSSSKSF